MNDKNYDESSKDDAFEQAKKDVFEIERNLAEHVLELIDENEYTEEVGVIAKEYSHFRDNEIEDKDESSKNQVFADSIKIKLQVISEKYNQPFDDVFEYMQSMAMHNSLINFLEKLNEVE